jgi:hypothetical protein
VYVQEDDVLVCCAMLMEREKGTYILTAAKIYSTDRTIGICTIIRDFAFHPILLLYKLHFWGEHDTTDRTNVPSPARESGDLPNSSCKRKQRRANEQQENQQAIDK